MPQNPEYESLARSSSELVESRTDKVKKARSRVSYEDRIRALLKESRGNLIREDKASEEADENGGEPACEPAKEEALEISALPPVSGPETDKDLIKNSDSNLEVASKETIKESKDTGNHLWDELETGSDMLPKHDAKSWFKTALNGFFIGLAIIVPGISGATISIIFKLYDKIIYAISSLLKHFKKSFIWLLPLIVGAVVGIVLGFFGVREALDYIPFAIVCLFAGLMIGAFPSVGAEIKGAKFTIWRVVLLIVGALVPIILSVITTNVISEAGTDPLLDVSWWEYICMFLAGAVVALTQIVPGLSASSFLMMIGYFTALMDSISLTYWKSNPSVLLVYVCLILGFLVGLILFSKVLNALFKRWRQTSFFTIVGLSFGSVVCMFYNPEIYETYTAWSQTGMSSSSISMGLDIGIGAGLLIVGLVISFLLVLFEFKKNGRKLEAEGDSLDGEE